MPLAEGGVAVWMMDTIQGNKALEPEDDIDSVVLRWRRGGSGKREWEKAKLELETKRRGEAEAKLWMNRIKRRIRWG